MTAMRMSWRVARALTVCGGLASCSTIGPGGDDPGGDPPLTGFTGTGGDPATTGDGAAGDGAGGDSTDSSTTHGSWDVPPDGNPTCGNADVGCVSQIDLLFVIDNSGSMGEEQLNLAKNFPLLIEKLENLTGKDGEMVSADVQIMVTTTDFGNPMCTPFQTHAPEKGAPIATGRNARIDRFTGLSSPPVSVPETCTDVCPVDIVPEDDFIRFRGTDPANNNVPDVLEVDINGDGTPDSAVAQALACIGPQGIDGCGYEAPLETMLQALNPGAGWNQAQTPFLRPNALLAVAVITDEADCSVRDYSVMQDANFQAVDPDSNAPQPSSAICWNAGVICNGPDANGVYSECTSTNDQKLQPVARYTDYLIQELREAQHKEVVMLGILGVPPVTERDPTPVAGGVLDLVYRDWRDPDYPNGGDILPHEWAAGVTAAHKQFDFGVGPGCTGEDGVGGFSGQAIPPVRIKEVCESLDLVNNDGETEVRCCIESICDTDFSPAIECLAGLIQDVVIQG